MVVGCPRIRGFACRLDIRIPQHEGGIIRSNGTIAASLYGILGGPERPFEPVSLSYTITGGTEAYQGDSGSGQATYTPKSEGFTLTFGS
jgi:hypothetical protein